MTPRCTVVVLTFNSATIIEETLRQALRVSDSVLVVDSGSTDGTATIAQALACTVLQRPFTNYSDQRNWAISQAAGAEWQLHLDADEVLDDLAIAETREIISKADALPCYMLRRRDYFMGKMLRFSGVNPWHLRLFRSGSAQCEHRLYDQHFFTREAVGRLKGVMHDKNALTLSDWTARHNRWSDLEAAESLAQRSEDQNLLQPRLFGDARERTRFLKAIYYKLPIAVRSSGYFFYRYIARLGFLDGVHGFYFAFFQAFWFRMLVDAKIYELRGQAK
jgi:glycosyltransferase involved in cell wall biosynthesis